MTSNGESRVTSDRGEQQSEDPWKDLWTIATLVVTGSIVVLMVLLLTTTL